MTQFRQNVILTVLLLGAAIYFAHLGKGDVALACVGIIAALWRHSGRDKEEGGGTVLPVGVVCLAFLAFGCSGWALPTGRAGVLEPVVWAVQPPPLSAAGSAAAPVVRGAALWIIGVDLCFARAVQGGGDLFFLSLQLNDHNHPVFSRSTHNKSVEILFADQLRFEQEISDEVDNGIPTGVDLLNKIEIGAGWQAIRFNPVHSRGVA